MDSTEEISIDFMVTHLIFLSLTKDMTGKEDVYRGPAIRALCRITDVSSLCLPRHQRGHCVSLQVAVNLIGFPSLDSVILQY